MEISVQQVLFSKKQIPVRWSVDNSLNPVWDHLLVAMVLIGSNQFHDFYATAQKIIAYANLNSKINDKIIENLPTNNSYPAKYSRKFAPNATWMIAIHRESKFHSACDCLCSRMQAETIDKCAEILLCCGGFRSDGALGEMVSVVDTKIRCWKNTRILWLHLCTSPLRKVIVSLCGEAERYTYQIVTQWWFLAFKSPHLQTPHVICSYISSQIFTDISTGSLIMTINHPYQLEYDSVVTDRPRRGCNWELLDARVEHFHRKNWNLHALTRSRWCPKCS